MFGTWVGVASSSLKVNSIGIFAVGDSVGFLPIIQVRTEELHVHSILIALAVNRRLFPLPLRRARNVSNGTKTPG